MLKNCLETSVNSLETSSYVPVRLGWLSLCFSMGCNPTGINVEDIKGVQIPNFVIECSFVIIVTHAP